MSKRLLEKKKIKKLNIPLRRKLSFFYSKSMLAAKLLAIVMLLAFCFTNYFTNLKTKGAESFYYITAKIGFIVKKVLVEGQLNLSNKNITNCLDADEGTAIFAIELDRVKNCLQNNDWVEQAIVQRRLPSTLYIALKERIPIAIWQYKNELYLIDASGYKITKDIVKFTNYLRVVGADANIYADSLLKQLSQYPDISKSISSATRFGERRWNLNLKQNIIIKMPERNFKLALNYLDNLFQANKLFDQNYKNIDLRSSEKYYIEKY